MAKHHFLLLLYFKTLQKGLFNIYAYKGKFDFLILILKMPFSTLLKDSTIMLPFFEWVQFM